MTSSNIDTLLKVAAPAAKPVALTPPSDSVDGFENYLRQAASTSSAPEKPRETASDKVRDRQLSVSGQGQGATASPDDESAETVVVEQREDNIENQAAVTPVDEVILSVAASTLVSVAHAEAVAEVDVVVEEVLVEPVLITGDAVPSEGENPLPSKQLLPEAETEAATVEDLPEIESEINTEVGDELAQELAEKIESAEQSAAKPQAEVVEASVAQKVVADQQLAGEKKTDAKKIENIENSEAKTADSETSPVVASTLEIPQPAVAESTELATASEPGETKAKLTVDSPAPMANSQAGSEPAIQPTNNLPANSEAVATRGETETSTSTIDRARFVQRVANAFRSAQQSDGPIQMRLSPPELGSLRIEIAVRNGVLSANLEAETADARRLLLDNLPALRQRLAEQEIRIDKFEVDIRRDGGQSDGQANAREQQSEQQASRASAQNRLRPTAAVEVLATRVPRSTSTSADAGLDVRI
ncbi:MAG: flagellar hook-length control protein FliK [Bythopirellula sp.]|nr:flagellar hook-length control protein FliK [Bythopirellula sp.]